MNYFSRLKKQRKPQGVPQKTLNAVFARFHDILQEDKPPLPRIVHVETRSRCNGQCNFCAAAVTTDTRSDITMDEALIDKILKELAAVNYPNRLSFYNNNEPFLDKRMPDIIAKARQMLPRAYLELKSNGKSLTLDKFHQVFQSGLDTLYISDYRSAEDFHAKRHDPKVAKILEEISRTRRFKGHFARNHYHNRVIIALTRVDSVLGTRAGSSPNREVMDQPIQAPCLRPFEMMTVNPSGLVALCSEDLFFDQPIGNLRQQGLWEIWTSPEYAIIRRELLKGNRACKPTCAKCDYRGYTMEVIEELGLTPDGMG